MWAVKTYLHTGLNWIEVYDVDTGHTVAPGGSLQAG